MDVEWIILADDAEVLNNKLYLLGGGWDSLTINGAPTTHYPCAVAVSFLVPWDETDQRHDVEVCVQDRDDQELVRVGAQIEVGRPAGVPLGQAQRVQVALRLALSLKELGTHAVIVTIEGREARRLSFDVLPGPRYSALLPIEQALA